MQGDRTSAAKILTSFSHSKLGCRMERVNSNFTKDDSTVRARQAANHIQSSAIITWSNIVRYYINNYRNWGRISIRCLIHKDNSYIALNGELWGVFCEYFWENWPNFNGTALYYRWGRILEEGYCWADILFRADSRFAPSQWETSLQSKAVSHWLGANLDQPWLLNKQRVLMHRHQGWNVRHGLCYIYMRYLYIYELFIAFVCFVVCSLL